MTFRLLFFNRGESEAVHTLISVFLAAYSCNMRHQCEHCATYCHPLRPVERLLSCDAFKTGYCLKCGQNQEQWRCYYRHTVPRPMHSPPIPPTPFRLLDLPIEIRLQIFQHLFAGSRVDLTAMYAPFRDIIIWRARPPQAGILRSCKLLNSEGTPILKDHLTVIFPLQFTSSYTHAGFNDRISDRIHHLSRYSRLPGGALTHMLPKGHLQQLHSSVHHIQLPELTLNNLARLNLEQYTYLKSVKFSLIKDENLGSRLRMLYTTVPFDESQLSESILQQEWSRNPLQCLRLPHSAAKVTAKRVWTPNFIGEKESYVSIKSHLLQESTPLYEMYWLTLAGNNHQLRKTRGTLGSRGH